MSKKPIYFLLLAALMLAIVAGIQASIQHQWSTVCFAGAVILLGVGSLTGMRKGESDE